MGTKKVNTSGCDGLAEKFNGTLINMLSKSVDKYGHDMDMHLPYLVFAYRVTVQESTGMLLFWLLWGHKPTLLTPEALTPSRSVYSFDKGDHGTELMAHLSDAWALSP